MEIVGDEPVSVFRIAALPVDGGVGEVRMRADAIGHRTGTPPKASFEQRSTGRPPRRGTIIGKFDHQRVHHFGGRDLVENAAARRRVLFSCSRSRIRFCAFRSSACSTAFAERGAHH